MTQVRNFLSSWTLTCQTKWHSALFFMAKWNQLFVYLFFIISVGDFFFQFCRRHTVLIALDVAMFIGGTQCRAADANISCEFVCHFVWINEVDIESMQKIVNVDTYLMRSKTFMWNSYWQLIVLIHFPSHDWIISISRLIIRQRNSIRFDSISFRDSFDSHQSTFCVTAIIISNIWAYKGHTHAHRV